MPVISIALMGFIAFSGGPLVAPQAAPFVNLEGTALQTEKLALADEPNIVRADGTKTYLVTLTSYNAVPEQTDANPTETASGVATNPEVIAARSVDLAEDLPFGTVIALERDAADSSSCRYGMVESQIGYRVIADSMHSRKREQIDVLLDPQNTVTVHGKEMNPSVALGLCRGVTIRVVGRLALTDIPATQEELRRIVEADTLAINR